MSRLEQIINVILCTGNPAHATVASAVKKHFHYAEFASRATGYDLRFWDPGSEDFFRNKIKNYNVFINSSFICGGGQLALLETVWQVWSSEGIKGTIINIGSMSEFLGVNDPKINDHVYGSYSIQKRALRDRSLQLNNKNGIRTSHIIAGGLNDGKPEHANYLNLEHIASTIDWILQNPADIPLLAIQQK
jgi:hypothetical protein